MEITIKIKMSEEEFKNFMMEDDSDNEIVEEYEEPSVSKYARYFDEDNPNWDVDNNHEYNLMFLRSTQQYANDLLKTKGYVFLNEVYELLGMEHSKEGQIVGWIYDPDNKDHIGDNQVKFEVHSKDIGKIIDGYEKAILIDFNVDGNILHALENEP